MHFYVVLSVFIHPCTQKRRRAQYSHRVDAAICVRALQMFVCARASDVCVCVCVCVCALQMCVCARASDVCVCVCVCASDVCVRFRCVCVCALQMCVCVCVCASDVCVCVRFRCVCALQMCVCVRASDVCVCVCASDVCVCVCVCALQMCARETSHTALNYYSNNPERLLCSPRAFRQCLYRVLTREIEQECTHWW